jgi:hypothetical protein
MQQRHLAWLRSMGGSLDMHQGIQQEHAALTFMDK